MTLEELKAKMNEIADELKQTYGICLIIELEEKKAYHFSGNLCPVCARDALTQYIIKKGIQHTRYHH